MCVSCSAGASVVPYHALGNARRMEVPDRRRQQDVMIEAVQNHTPQVVVVDEVGTAEVSLQCWPVTWRACSRASGAAQPCAYFSFCVHPRAYRNSHLLCQTN